jgi:hypothetical protein
MRLHNLILTAALTVVDARSLRDREVPVVPSNSTSISTKKFIVEAPQVRFQNRRAQRIIDEAQH